MPMLLAKSAISEIDRAGLLWDEMKAGNEYAFREIFENYGNHLFQYGVTICRDRDLVKDCIQELFVAIWSNRKSLGHARSIKHYLLSSLRRLILKRLKRSKRLFPFLFLHHDTQVEGQDQAIMRDETQRSNRLLVTSAVCLLPARQREVVYLKFYQSLNNDEIGKIMKLNNQVVRNTLCRALQGLRNHLREKSATASVRNDC